MRILLTERYRDTEAEPMLLLGRTPETKGLEEIEFVH